MKKQITRISPLQTAKVLGIVYCLASLPILLAVLIPAFISSNPQKAPLALVLAMPLLYGALGFLFTIFGAWVYNLVAKFTGGIEYTAIEKIDS